MVETPTPDNSSGSPPQVARGAGRQSRQVVRRRAMVEAVMAEGALRIEQLAEQFGISLMTAHRDLDELESRGLLRKTRGVATALATSLVESSDVYRSSRQIAEKEAVARAALDFIESGQSLILDDSTTTLHLVPHLYTKAPLTVITNVLTIMNQLAGVQGITMLALGGQYYNWCNAFMGGMTQQAIGRLRPDVSIMSTPAITDDVVYHQMLETVDTKRAMLNASQRRILMVDHTKFEKRALHRLAPLTEFDVVIVDAGTAPTDVERMRSQGISVVVAPPVADDPEL
jgi:DeoR/GlpR family transcriptional regulator of sugar metabolism